MRLLTDHKTNPANDTITIDAVDGPGPGGASHKYDIVIPYEEGALVQVVHLAFQNGAIGEVGVNGITHEVLLAILIDRLRSFEAGPYACRENAIALTKMEESLMWLHKRTMGRMKRGVEGTHKP